MLTILFLFWLVTGGGVLVYKLVAKHYEHKERLLTSKSQSDKEIEEQRFDKMKLLIEAKRGDESVYIRDMETLIKTVLIDQSPEKEIDEKSTKEPKKLPSGNKSSDE